MAGAGTVTVVANTGTFTEAAGVDASSSNSTVSIKAHQVSLTGAIKVDADGNTPIVWGTFYDIRRYGGLQIFLRAVLGRTASRWFGPDRP